MRFLNIKFGRVKKKYDLCTVKLKQQAKTFRTMKTFEELKAQVMATKSISWMTAEERDFYMSEQLKRKDEQKRIEKQERKTRNFQRYQISRQQREASVKEWQDTNSEVLDKEREAIEAHNSAFCNYDKKRGEFYAKVSSKRIY